MSAPRRLAFVLWLAAPLAGCGGGAGRVPVAGEVSVDGRSLTEGAITFYSPDTGASAAAPIAEGRYALAAADGPSPGRQVVRILAFRPVPGRADPRARRSAALDPVSAAQAAEAAGHGEREQYLPARFNTRSELTAELAAGGSDALDFRLALGR